MDLTSIPQLTASVLIASAVIGTLFGAIAHRTHFCTMGAVSDIVNMGDWSRMRQWGLAVGVAMVGVGVLAFTGHVDFSKTLYASQRWMWLSALVGGLMFGVGMVLASGCGNKTLVRIGAGSLKSVVVFLAMGVAAFATLKGITAVARVVTVDRVFLEFASQASIPGVMSGVVGLSPAIGTSAFGGLFGLILIVWALRDRHFRIIENLVGGVGIGGLIVSAWWLSGHFGYVAEHPETLQEAFVATNSGRAEALSFVAPMAHTLDWLMFFSDKSQVLSFGVVALMGVVLGAFLSARFDGTFRWEGFGSVEDVANHLVGGVLMGVGGVTAMGCTVGQGLSGLSTLSLTSVVAVLAIIIGAVLALRYQVWRTERMV
jgi:uncharacterized protein